ncbi:acyltransferase [Carnobacterium mobile]|uniref:acyltransferase n=1 Tax=Carnobacterium mobile TaxID=2750 RepID=UPI0018670D78|nr:acyltransferase [Carnobacterium mobile]
MEKKERSSNLEFLRIISMILIIMHHYVIHGDFKVSNDFTLNKNIIQMASMGGKLGVDLFVLITGFFTVKSSGFKVKKLLRLLFEVQTYSILFYVLFISFGNIPFSMEGIVKAVFPVTFSSYWFATNYILLYILSPFINQFLINISKRTYNKLLIVAFVIWVVIPTVTGAELGLSYLFWFILMYSVGAYIQLFPMNYFEKTWLNIGIAGVTYSLVLLSVIIFNFLGQKINGFSDNSTYFMAYNKLPIVITAVSMFIGFKKLKIKNSKFINGIASATFGIYLIHDHYLVRPFLWIYIFKNNSFYTSNFLVFHMVLTVGGVFVISVLLDKLRIRVVEIPMFKFLEKINWLKSMSFNKFIKVKDKGY